ncbi:MAG TPA: ABC transporter permease [Egibacteraceae bacterium]|nr:ABC transporter permease [Egibacteraceae bacterium]
MTPPASEGRQRTDREPASRRGSSGLVETYFRMAPVTVPIYAVIVAAAVGGLVILAVGSNPITAYTALLGGAFGSWGAVLQTLARSTPFIVAALAVAFGFKAGLFNIGAEGQLLIGAVTAAWAGTWSMLAGAPPIVYLPVMVVAGALGGLVWGGIPGMLKARTGAHEVITTIMLNAIAIRLLQWLIGSRTPVILLDVAASQPRTRPIAQAARYPSIVGPLDISFVIAVGLCAAVWFVLQRTTLGFEIRTVGTNPNAARYAGMSVPRIVILVLAVAGALAGIGGAGVVAGSTGGFLTPGLLANIGFDSIAIALLARANPFGVIPAAILWGALLTGAPLMQLQADLSLDLVRIIQALIILFVAADAIVRFIFRIRKPHEADALHEEAIFAKGWGV